MHFLFQYLGEKAVTVQCDPVLKKRWFLWRRPVVYNLKTAPRGALTVGLVESLTVPGIATFSEKFKMQQSGDDLRCLSAFHLTR